MKIMFARPFAERNHVMKDKFDIAATVASDSLVMYVHTAPSLRVPVTPANRTLLRRLRAAELSDWEAGRPFPGQVCVAGEPSHLTVSKNQPTTFMKTLRSLTSGLLLAAMAITSNVTFAASTGELLQQGLYAEEVEGNIDSAIKDYEQVIQNSSAPPNHIAQALYRQGMCYLKIKDEAAARGALEKLVAEYPGQTEIIEKARPVLNELTDFDPASLMPPGTLVYVEFGTPGRQVETILNTLKGTPFENPLATLAGQKGQPGQQTNNQKSPGDIVGALLNPSMMAEFKKIRSSAIGITGIAQNNPPMVAVLYPGKSDALRGLILAALGMAGTAGEPMDGMQTVIIKDFGAVAYDDNVIITAHPADQLAWSVKQYKGLSSEPSLASSNKSFTKLSKAQRQKKLVTVWANVDETYAQLLKMFPAGQIPAGVLSANALMDFSNIDELTLTHSVETNGLATRLELQFKDGHHCLAYDLIRTPNIGKAALEAVPAEAIGLVSFSLSQSDGLQADKVREKIQNYTGLEVGREVFANIEQVALFAMPATDVSTTNTFLPGQLGLAITSRNPDQTRQIITTLLGTMSGVQPGAASGQYKISKAGQPERYCYVDQVAGTTLVSLNRSVVDAAAASLKNHKSICASGPLNRAVNELTPAASKLVLVNAGGAIRLLEPQMKFGKLNDEQAAQLKTNLDQLARAADGTTIELRTDEQADNFAINSGVSGLPRLNEVIAPVQQIQRIRSQAQAESVAKQLRLEKPATIRQAAQAPVIDGKVDDLWNAAQSYQLDNVLTKSPASTNNLAAEYKSMWDENNLYVLVEVTDSILRHDPNIAWHNNDGIELYLDADDAKAADYGQNDHAYAFIWDATSPEIWKKTENSRTNGVKYAMVTTDKGYRLEAAFPWTTLGAKPSAGAKIGLEVQVNDNQGNKERDGKLSWHDDNDRAWQSPQAFGNAELAGLIGWWKFDETEGATAEDSSGNHHDGKLVGNAKWAQGRNGGAIALDGKGSFVQIADKSAFDLGGEITIAGWVNIHSVSADWMAIVTKGDSAWRLSTVARESHFHFSVNTPNEAFINGSTTFGFNEWHHVAAVYEGKTVRLYVDGKPDGESPWTGGIAKNDADVLIGENVEQPNRCFDGLIDDMRIYNYALSESEIKTLAAGQ